MNLRVLGYALQRAWVFLLFLGMASSSLTVTGAPIPPQVYLCSSCVLCVVLFYAALRELPFLRFVSTGARRWLGPVLTSLGTICGFVVIADSTISSAMGVLCGVFTGLGSGLIDLGYGEIYRNIPPEKTALEIPVATFLAAVIYALVMAAPLSIMFFVTMLLPMASGLVYLHTYHIWEPGRMPTVKPVSMNVSKFTWRIGVCACLVGLADSLVRQVFIHINGIPLASFYQPGMVLSCLIVVVVLVGHRLFATDVNYRSVYKFVVFIMAFFFMLLPVFTGSNTAESVFALVSYNCFNVLIWMLLAELAYTYRLSSLVVFGIGWGMVTLGVALGQLTAAWIVDVVTFTPQIVSLIALVCTLLVLGSYMFVLREDDMVDITKVDDDEPAQAEVPEEGEPVRTPFKDRCNQLAQEYGLTPRETEVMILFAKGRSSTRIQEDLVLSRGTVTTHLRHIYQKMDVHSKQEFLDKIENAE